MVSQVSAISPTDTNAHIHIYAHYSAFNVHISSGQGGRNVPLPFLFIFFSFTAFSKIYTPKRHYTQATVFIKSECVGWLFNAEWSWRNTKTHQKKLFGTNDLLTSHQIFFFKTQTRSFSRNPYMTQVGGKAPATKPPTPVPVSHYICRTVELESEGGKTQWSVSKSGRPMNTHIKRDKVRNTHLMISPSPPPPTRSSLPFWK